MGMIDLATPWHNRSQVSGSLGPRVNLASSGRGEGGGGCNDNSAAGFQVSGNHLSKR